MKIKFLLIGLLLFFISTTILSGQGITNISSIGGTKSDYPYRLIKDKIGNHFVIGFFASPTLKIGTTTLTNSGDTNAFIAKFDQNWNALWARSSQGNNVDYGLSCVTDDLGNCYMVGCFYSNTVTFGTFTLTNANPITTCDLFVVKYDPTGTVLWAKSAGGTGTDKAIDVDIDNSDGVVVTGWFYSSSIAFGAFPLTNSGTATADIFITKYNSAGTEIWAKKATGTADDEPTSLSLDALGNIYLTGWFGSNNLQFGAINLVNNGGFFPRKDMFIAKFNSSGTEQWAKVAGGTKQDGGSNIAVDDAGNFIYVTGAFNSDSLLIGSKTIKNTGGYDFFLARYDNTGQLIWVQNSSGKGNETGSGMTIDNRGFVYVIGGFTSTQLFIGYDTLFNKSTTDAFGQYYSDVFYARYNPDGTEEWAASLGGLKNDVGTSITIENYYKISLTGVFVDTIQVGTGTTKLYGKGGTDIFLAEYKFINIGGIVTNNTTSITKGFVELRRINPGKRAPVADHMNIMSGGRYRFSDVKSGSYYIYAVADTVLYPTLVKTYYLNSPYWTSAVKVNVLTTDTLIDTLNISMMDEIVLPSGTGKISGMITSLDGTRAAGKPIKDAEVTLMKIPPSRIAYKSYTDSSGNYLLSGLATGTYRLMMDIPGLKLDSAYLLNISEGTTAFKNRNYLVDANGIHIDTTASGIYNKERISDDLQLYPNPAKDKLFLQFTSVKSNSFEIDMYDLTGKQIMHQPSINTAIYGIIELDVSSLNNGVYILRISSENQINSAKIIINK